VPTPADDAPDVPADTALPATLDGYWQNEAGDIFVLSQSGDSIAALRGQPWVCRPSGPARFDNLSDGYAQTQDFFQVQRTGEDLVGQMEVCWFGGGEEPNWAPVALRLTLGSDADALSGSWRDDAANRDVPLALSRLPVPTLAPVDFGLPPTSLRIADYGVKLVSRTDGTRLTVPEKYVFDPATDDALVRHTGLDFVSRDERWVVASVPFTSPVRGQVYVYPQSEWNTVAVLLETGDQLQFLHAASLAVRSGEWVEAGTILGATGSAGASVIQLHVQAKNRKGEFVSPDWVVERARGDRRG
jgi:hypothetical protein